MKIFKLKNLLIYLQGLFIFDFLSIFPNFIFAKEFKSNNSIEINEKFESIKPNLISNSFELSKGDHFSKLSLINDLKANGEKLLNLLAFEQDQLSIDSSVEIDSDVQYRVKEIFYAEGNAIIYLSNATLRGDLIKYDLEKKLLTVVGNVVFKKGEQYFEASKLFYNLNEDIGYIDNVYGLLDSKTFAKDFKLEIKKLVKKEIEDSNKNEVNQPKLIDNASIGLVNKFEDDKSLNVKSADLKIPEISRWRYKTKKLIYTSKTLESKKIFFTNDIYNEPQFIFLSKNFSAEIKDNKLKLLSKNSWIIFDNKLKIPLGRRAVFDRDPLTKWGIGADYKEKDGYFLFRSTNPKEIFGDYSFQLQPYFLIQRALMGSTNSFSPKDASVFSSKVKTDAKISDYFALDLNLNGKENNWDVASKIQLNSLNVDRLDQSLRTKLTLTKFINLNKKTDVFSKKDNNLDKYTYKEESENSLPNFSDGIQFDFPDKNLEKGEKEFSNSLSMQLYNIFREKVVKDFATEEIYFASGFNVANKKKWSINNKTSNLSLIFDFGHFKSKSKKANQFKELFRNALVAQYNYKFPIWRNSSLDKSIDESYKFSPEVVKQSLYWSTGLQSGIFLYSDGSNQSALKFNTGPVLILGSLKKKFLDYTKLNANYSYVFKEGESPFSFDSINDTERIKFGFEQQIYGPLIFGFGSTLNLENGNYSNVNYSLNFKRRAYTIGAFYNSSDESLGIRFNIFNFDYSGLSKKF